MKPETTGYIGIGICLTLFISAHVIASDNAERNKREFRPIQPINKNQIKKPFATFAKRKRVKVDLPQHDPNRTYYGPDGALFPTPKLNFNK